MTLRGYTAIAAHLATHGPGFDWTETTTDVDPRHALYRLSQRGENPLPIDGPVGLPVTTSEALDVWVERERKRGGREALPSSQLGLFEGA